MSRNSEAVAVAMGKLGSAYRGDWNDFDGRTLRDQLSELASALMSDVPFDVERWLVSAGVCPVNGSWHEYCDDRSEGVGPYSCDHARRVNDRLTS